MSIKPETISWHPGTYTLDYVLRNLSLPQVVQCDHSACGVGSVAEGTGRRGSSGLFKKQNPQTDGDYRGRSSGGCASPVLLYHVRDTPVVSGVCVLPGGEAADGKGWVDSGSKVSIPVNYPGWFAVFRSTPGSGDVPVVRDIPKLLTCKAQRVLLGGSQDLDVLVKTDRDYRLGVICPGIVLNIISSVFKPTKYLHCRDEKDNTFLIPFSSKVHFYVLSSKKKMTVRIGRVHCFISKVKLPCYVRPINEQWNQLRNFTGLMKLTSVDSDPYVVGATVTLTGQEFVEIRKGSESKYKIATLNSGWLKYQGYKSAVRACEEGLDSYLRNIMLHTNKSIVDSSASPTSGSSSSTSRKSLDSGVVEGHTPWMKESLHHEPPKGTDNVMFGSISEDDSEDENPYIQVWKTNTIADKDTPPLPDDTAEVGEALIFNRSDTSTDDDQTTSNTQTSHTKDQTSGLDLRFEDMYGPFVKRSNTQVKRSSRDGYLTAVQDSKTPTGQHSANTVKWLSTSTEPNSSSREGYLTAVLDTKSPSGQQPASEQSSESQRDQAELDSANIGDSDDDDDDDRYVNCAVFHKATPRSKEEVDSDSDWSDDIELPDSLTGEFAYWKYSSASNSWRDSGVFSVLGSDEL